MRSSSNSSVNSVSEYLEDGFNAPSSSETNGNLSFLGYQKQLKDMETMGAFNNFMASLHVGSLVGVDINGKVRKGHLQLLLNDPFILSHRKLAGAGKMIVGVEVDVPESELGGMLCIPTSQVPSVNRRSFSASRGYFVFVDLRNLIPVKSTEEKICEAMGVDFKEVKNCLDDVPDMRSLQKKEASEPLVRTRLENRRRALCIECNNNNPNQFVTDKKGGDLTCLICGVVAVGRQVHQGEWKRNFEGEESKSQHGAKPDPLMSSGFNLRTRITGDDQLSKSLRRMQNDVEMNLSQFGKDDRVTRTGYKDVMKLEAFQTMKGVQENCDLGDPVVSLAKRLFALLRDNTEAVRNKDRTIAVCLVKAYKHMARERERVEYEIAKKKKEEEAAATASALLPRFRCNCVWEWEVAPGVIDQRMVAKRRALKVPKYKLQQRMMRNKQGSVGSSGGGDGKAAISLWRKADEEATSKLERVWEWVHLGAKQNRTQEEVKRFKKICENPPNLSVLVNLDGGAYNASFKTRSTEGGAVLSAAKPSSSAAKRIHLRLAVAHIDIDDGSLKKAISARFDSSSGNSSKKLHQGSGLIAKDRNRKISAKSAALAVKGIFCKIRINFKKAGSERLWNEIIETRVYAASTATVDGGCDCNERFFVELEEGVDVLSMEVKVMCEALPRSWPLCRGLLRFNVGNVEKSKSASSDVEKTAMVNGTAATIPKEGILVKLFSDASKPNYADVPSGSFFGSVKITGWESRVRRKEGCYAVFTSKKALRFHKCPAAQTGNVKIKEKVGEKRRKTNTFPAVSNRNSKKKRMSSLQRKGLAMYKEL
eukprot:g5788.t1